jgi:hypothetical protein
MECKQLDELIGGIFSPSLNSIEKLVEKGVITEEQASELQDDLKNIVNTPNEREQLDFVFKGINADVKVMKLIKIFGIEKLFDLYERFNSEVIPSLIYNPNANENEKFTDFNKENVVNTKILEYKKKVTEDAVTDKTTRDTLLSDNYDKDKVDISDASKIYHTFNDLITLFGQDTIVNDKGVFKLKFDSGLKSGAFRSDDSHANGTEEIPHFAKIYLSTLKDEDGVEIDFVNVQTQFAKLQKHPFYSKLNGSNIYPFISKLLEIKSLNNPVKEAIAMKEHIKEFYSELNDEQSNMIRKHYANFLLLIDDNFEKMKSVNDFLETMNNDVDTIKDNELKDLYRSLHTSIINAVSTVSGQKYSMLIKDGEVYKEEISGEYSQDFAQIIAEGINSYAKMYAEYEGDEKETVIKLLSGNTLIKNHLGLDWSDSDVKKDFYKRMGYTTPESKKEFEENLFGNGTKEKPGELNNIIDSIRKGEAVNTSSFKNFEQLIRYKQIKEQGTPTSVVQNISGDAVPSITLTSNMQRYMSVINNLIDKSFNMFKNNPFVNGDLKIDFVVAGGIDNGKDKTDYKKLSRPGQINHDIIFKYWNNVKNKYVQFLPYEYSDKSKNPYVKINTESLHDTDINDYSKVVNMLHKSQQTVYNGQVEGMIKQITDVINFAQLNIPVPTDFNSLQQTYAVIKGDEKLAAQVIRASSDMISKGMNVAPFFKNVNDTFELDKTFVEEINRVNNKAEFEKSLKKQIIKDALYGFATGFKFDDHINNVKPAGIANFRDYTILFDTDKMTSDELNELKKAIKTNVDAFITDKNIDALFARVNPMFKRYAYDWQLVSVNMTQMSEGLLHQYKGKSIHSKWLDSTKRNVFPFANGQAFTFGLPNGLEEESYVAVVKDPTLEIFNVLGNYKKQDSEDGSEFITEEDLEKSRNSVGAKMGNEIGDVLKTINTGFDYNLGVAQKEKKADHTIMGEKVRGSLATLKLLTNMYSQMKYSDLLKTPVTVTIPEHTYAVRTYKDGVLGYDVITKPAASYDVDSMFDIRSKFGQDALGFDIVVEDKNGDIEVKNDKGEVVKRYRYANSRDKESSTQIIINQIEPQLAEIDSRLKGYHISRIVLESARKSGAGNLNNSDTLENGNFLVSKQTNTSRFVQLNAYHEIDDHADITVASQITGAAGFNAHVKENKDNARKLYETYADLINFTLKEEIPDISADLSQKGKEFIVKLLEDKTSDLDVINMTSQILNFYGKEGISEVLKSQYISGKISSAFNSKLSDLIQFKLNGFQAIMGANLTEVYRTDGGKLYNYQDAKAIGLDLNSKSRLQAQQFDLIGDVGSVSMYKTKAVIDQFIARNINQIDDNGKVIEGDYSKANKDAHAKLEQLGRLLGIVDNNNKQTVSDKRLEAEMQQQLNAIVNGEVTAVQYYDYSIQQLHEDLKTKTVEEILAKLAEPKTINVSSYNSKPAEIIVPFKWAKQYGIKIGTNVNDISVDYFIKQIQALKPDELQKMLDHFSKEYGITDINDIANKQYQSFQKALEVIVGRINRKSFINSLNLGKLQLTL